MTTEKMTVHKALCELKTLDSRIQKCMQQNPFVFANKHANSKVAGVSVGDYEEVRKYHKEMGAVCFENTKMGLYFINDPDDYWIEILPLR